MTWKEFKEYVEGRGVEDGWRIVFLSVDHTEHDHSKVEDKGISFCFDPQFIERGLKNDLNRN